MKKAWELFRTKLNRSSFGTCLMMAWKIAKAAAERETFTGKAVSLMGYTFNYWRGGKNRRVYINGTRTYGAYIDLNTMKAMISGKASTYLIIAAEAFMAKYEIAC
jgi:hypothetical protein